MIYILIVAAIAQTSQYLKKVNTKYNWKALAKLQSVNSSPFIVYPEDKILSDTKLVIDFSGNLNYPCAEQILNSSNTVAVEVTENYGVVEKCSRVGLASQLLVRPMYRRDPTNGFIMNFEGGDRCFNIEQNIWIQKELEVRLYCDDKQESKFQTTRGYTEDDCEIYLEMYSPAGCGEIYSYWRKGGWFIIYWGLGIMALYFIGGSIYLYYQDKTQGLQIPHAVFWKEFYLNVKAGCQLAYDIMTRSTRDKSYDSI